ncbi:MAG: GTP-binding protein [Desulfobacteraceae bacterium]|nr:GTP-binding protein [Desulfobacteraceae bacterium]
MKQHHNPTGDDKTAVVLLSGFLGAGKTTLLKNILSWQADLSDTVVLVNEFGAVGIDGGLLKDAGSEVIELNSGCICCTLSTDLRKSLLSIRKQFRPARIFIESTGVADPVSVAEVINHGDLARSMTLKRIVTVLDADFWEAREVFGPVFYSQLEMAHLILLNKVDALDSDKIPVFLKEIHAMMPHARVIPTIHCRIDPDVLGLDARPIPAGLKPMSHYQPGGRGRHHRAPDAGGNGHAPGASAYTTFSFTTPGILDESRFMAFLGALPFDLFRVKGPVRFQDRVVMLNHVGGKSEFLPWNDETETRLAVIGWRIDADPILEQLSHCITEEP